MDERVTVVWTCMYVWSLNIYVHESGVIEGFSATARPRVRHPPILAIPNALCVCLSLLLLMRRISPIGDRNLLRCYLCAAMHLDPPRHSLDLLSHSRPQAVVKHGSRESIWHVARANQDACIAGKDFKICPLVTPLHATDDIHCTFLASRVGSKSSASKSH